MSTLYESVARYNRTAILLHWVLGILIVGASCVGLYMTGLPLSPARIKLYNWHKWAGMTIFALSLLRLYWRFTHRPPALPAAVESAMRGWQLRAFHGGHHLMYALFVAVPLLGWAHSSAAGVPIVWFGVLPLPDLAPTDKALAAVLKPLHQWCAYTLLAAAGVHAGAALKHQFIDRDGLLARMGVGRPTAIS